MEDELELSVVIVNYNTRTDLENCLASITRSRQNMGYEVSVVDNCSTDGSPEMVKRRFPSVRLIENNSNLGFSKANNVALRRVRSPFILLLNPDTILFDHVFDDTVQFLKTTPDAGMVSCKLVKKDGTLDLACRRSFPSIFDGFCRAVGLSRIFPKSRSLARYNLTFLDENKISEVDAVNGAFMMVKREAVAEAGLLDEDYFMYMEDLDWCFQFRKHGWKIYYVPTSQVIHLKGQSGKKSSGKMIREFFKSMELFCRKNYLPYQPLPKFWLTVVGIRIWKDMTLLKNALRLEKRVTP